METGGSLTAPDSVRKLQTALHAKAKGFPDFRFYSLSDKVWRADVMESAWQAVRRNGGAAGVDGETVQHIERRGVERWLGELAGDLKEGTYRPGAVRQVLIPKKQAGKVRPLGIPCVRDRVAQTAALLVLTPIFEADLEPEQYAYRAGRSAQDAVKRVHRLLNTGHREVVDADLSNYFGEIPHAELVRSIARRVSDGRLLGWIKAWLEMPVEEDDGKGGQRRTNRARRERAPWHLLRNMPLAAYMVNFHFDSRTAITFVLAGQPELRELLKYSAFAALRQRIRISYHMPAMTLQETCTYIDHHTARCGRPSSIFADDAKADIHRHAARVPRLVNALCYRSILHAAAHDLLYPTVSR